MVRDQPTQSIGDRLKDVREKDLRGMSRPKLVAMLQQEGIDLEEQGVSLGRYESGEREAPASLVSAVARIARVSPEWLLTGEGDRYTRAGEASDRLARIRNILDGAFDPEPSDDPGDPVPAVPARPARPKVQAATAERILPAEPDPARPARPPKKRKPRRTPQHGKRGRERRPDGRDDPRQ